MLIVGVEVKLSSVGTGRKDILLEIRYISNIQLITCIFF